MYQYNLAKRFEDVASQRGDQIALWFSDDQQITYANLNQLANRTARWLLDRGVKKTDVVCINGEKSAGTFAAMLACLKIGCTYAILDPDSPVERLRKMLSTCRPKLVINDLNVESYDDSNLNETRDVT